MKFAIFIIINSCIVKYCFLSPIIYIISCPSKIKFIYNFCFAISFCDFALRCCVFLRIVNAECSNYLRCLQIHCTGWVGRLSDAVRMICIRLQTCSGRLRNVFGVFSDVSRTSFGRLKIFATTTGGEPARGARSAPPVGRFTHFAFVFVFVSISVLFEL